MPVKSPKSHRQPEQGCMKEEQATSGYRNVVGGVDTHKDLHVAAVVDEHVRLLGSECFPTTRHGYKQMLLWMRSFGELARVGVECTGSYGAGLLRYLQQAHVMVLEVTTPDKSDRRKRGKDDTLDACNAAHAAFAGVRTVTPKTRDGMIESLRVLKVCRKTAISARRVALQLIHNTISFAALYGVSPVPASSGKVTTSTESRWGSCGQQCPAHHCHRSLANRRSHKSLCRQTRQRGAFKA
jgi:transposase